MKFSSIYVCKQLNITKQTCLGAHWLYKECEANIMTMLLFYFLWRPAIGLGSLTVAVELQEYQV